ncbi:MAG: phosphoribosylamine--glycine ligase [Oscillatoriales cyanobacterium SM2_2_1]|nr:phosphoribosylamine--glycine ligase [Oscillatoriales cyanobacterium SM2_2_1]
MKVLVVGSGGREHAIAWRLLQSAAVTQVFCIPGNGGTATLPNCRNVSLSVDDFEGILRFAQVQGVALTVVGHELPLALGIVDFFLAANAPIFGPTRAGAQIESSKSWAKELMHQAGIPTAMSAVFTDLNAALTYLGDRTLPIVIKADGLAGGKGVTIAHTQDEAQATLIQLFGGALGDAGSTVVIEEFLAGQELSILAVTDGQTIRPLLPAQDHKRLEDGDRGPNTGGMGAYAPSPLLTDSLMIRIEQEILQPAIATLRQRGIDYRGCLYAGLMITSDGTPYVIEFNCRFGDPETQTILPLLDTPLEQILLACTEQRLESLGALKWLPQCSVCVVAAAQGYPQKVETGHFITGIGKATEQGGLVFHAGTKLKNNSLVTHGGRVLGITCLAPTHKEAITRAYHALDNIYYEGMIFRKDIGHRALAPSTPETTALNSDPTPEDIGAQSALE